MHIQPGGCLKEEHGKRHLPLVDQVANAKVLKQEVPVEQEKDQGIQSEQGKTNREQCQKDRSVSSVLDLETGCSS